MTDRPSSCQQQQQCSSRLVQFKCSFYLTYLNSALDITVLFTRRLKRHDSNAFDTKPTSRSKDLVAFVLYWKGPQSVTRLYRCYKSNLSKEQACFHFIQCRPWWPRSRARRSHCSGVFLQPSTTFSRGPRRLLTPASSWPLVSARWDSIFPYYSCFGV